MAALLGDTVFTLTRRTVLSRIANDVSCWSYLGTNHHQTHCMGTYHESDVPDMYYAMPKHVPGEILQTYSISFVNFLDLNVISTSAPLIHWAQWEKDAKQLINIKPKEVLLLEDNFHQSNYLYLLKQQSELRA